MTFKFFRDDILNFLHIKKEHKMVDAKKEKIRKIIYELQIMENEQEGVLKRVKYLEGCLADYQKKGVFVPVELLQLDNETLGLKVKQMGAKNEN